MGLVPSGDPWALHLGPGSRLSLGLAGHKMKCSGRVEIRVERRAVGRLSRGEFGRRI